MAYPKNGEPIPAFDPNKPFTEVKGDVPAFDPGKPFTEVKKKEQQLVSSQVFSGLSNRFINTGLPSTANPTDFKMRQEGRVAPMSNSKRIPTWKRTPEVSMKPQEDNNTNPFPLPDKVTFNPSLLDETEQREYEQRKDKINPNEQPELIKQIINERNDSNIRKQRALSFVSEDLKGEGASAQDAFNQHGLDIPQYFNRRKNEIYAQVDKLNADMDDLGLKWAENVQINPEYQQKRQEKIRLLGKLDEMNKYANELNEDYAINSTDPSKFDNRSDYLKTLGNNLNKVDDYEGATKKEQDIYNGTDKNNVSQKEDFNNELRGIKALEGSIREKATKGEVTPEQAKADLTELSNENVKLEQKYPEVKMDNLRNRIGEYIAENRKEKDGTLNSAWHNIVWAEPSEKEVDDAIRTVIVNTDGQLNVSEQEIAQLKKEKEKIPLTGMIGHAYKKLILDPSQSLDKWINGADADAKKHYERNLEFQDAPINQSIQPGEIATETQVSPGVMAIRNAPNPNAGKRADFFSSATLNNIGEVAGIIGSYVAGNKGFGALGMENIGANIATSAFLNHHNNLEGAKKLTDNSTEQELIASAKDIITGIVFAGIKPSELVGKVESAGEDASMKKLLDAFRKDGVANTDPTKFKDLVKGIIINTGKDLGKNIALMDADKMADFAIDALVNKRSVENRDLGHELLSDLPNQMASLGIFSAFHGAGKAKMEVRDREAAIGKMAEAARNMSEFETQIDNKVSEGKITKEEGLLNKQYAEKVAEKLMSNDLQTGRTQNFTREQKLAYAFNLAKEQDLKDKAKDLTDKVQIDEHNKDIKELGEERKAILSGKQDDYNQIAELHARALSKGTHDQTLNAGTKTEGVQFLTDQSLTAPAPTKRSLKGDTELTTDLIARNEPQKIKEELKSLKADHKKLIEGEKKAEANEVQKNIDLLEAGLEKQNKPKEELPDLTVPIEGTDKKGVPIGEDVPPEVSVEPPKKVAESIPLVEGAEIKPDIEINPVKIEVPKEIPEPIKLVDETKETIKVPNTEKEAGIADVEPPKTPLPAEEGEGGKKGITHAAVDELRKIIDLPEYEGKPVETHEQLIAEAQTVIKDNPNAANEVLEKMEKGKKVTNKDNAVLAIYKATLDAELANNPNKELFDRASRLARTLDVAGTEAGKLLESRKLVGGEDTLTNFLLEKQAAQGTALTETQVKDEAAKYEELKAANKALEAQLEIEREQHKKDIAELGLNKAKAKARKDAKKSNEEYKEERKASVEAAREALKKLRDEGLKSTVPLVRELAAIAPHVKDYVKSLVNEGVDKLDNIIAAVHAEFKDVLEGLTNRQVLDIIAGDHDAPKEKTKNEKANTVRLLKREAQLIKELEKARKGEEKAKTEKDKTAASRRIDELTEKIKEVRRLNKESQIEDEGVTEGSEFAKTKETREDNKETDFTFNKKAEEKLQQKISKLEKDIREKRYLEEKEKPPVFKKSKKTQEMEDKVIDLENKIRHERSKDEYNKRGAWKKAFDKVMEVLGIRRLVQSAMDMSVPFRQGATMISYRKADIWLKGFQANLKSVLSPKKFERIMYAIRKDPQYHDMVKDNIVYNDLGSADPNLHNEDFRKSFIYHIPLVSEPLKASNRSADAFLNVARYEMYKKQRRALEQKGLTRESDPEAFKHMGNFVMSMTGRGRMNRIFEGENMSNVLGNTFYGARLMASRFNLLNPVTYLNPKIPKQAKMEAFQDLAAFTITTMAIGTALSTVAGAKISLNPDDSDFLQARWGDKVYDLSGGLANYIRTFLRMTKAIYTKATGTKYQGKKAIEFGGTSTLNFFRNKLSPNTAYAADAIFGKAYGGEFDPWEIVQIYPMYTEDVIKAWKTEGGTLALTTVLLPNILGIGYGSYASKGQIDKTLEDLKKRNMRTDEMNNENLRNWKEGGRKATDEETDKYIEKRDAEIEKDLEVLFNNGIKGIPYEELTPEEVKDETSYIKANATKKAKEEIFGVHKLTHQEKRQAKILSKERHKKYQEN